MTITAILKQKPFNVVVVRPQDRMFEVVRGLARGWPSGKVPLRWFSAVMAPSKTSGCRLARAA